MSQNIIKLTSSTNTGILTAAGTALAASESRQNYSIQNLDTDPLFVKEGASASVTDFTYVLSGGTAPDDGTGGSYESQAGQVYSGIVTVAGTTPRFVAAERKQ